MNQKKAKFTWHYYVMALGGFMALMAATLSAWGAVVSSVAIMIVSHPRLEYKGLTRFLFLLAFFIMYYVAFPDPQVVQEMMPNDVPMAE